MVLEPYIAYRIGNTLASMNVLERMPVSPSLAQNAFITWCDRHRSTLLLKSGKPPKAGLPYRKIAVRIEGREALVLRWAANVRCLPHDHGNSSGFVYLLKGHLRNILLEPINANFDAKPGDILAIERYQVHYMETKTESVSVHFYTGNETNFWVYDPDKRTRWLVKPNAGAWSPAPSDILREEPCQLRW